jgi:hypothetical protein
MKGKKAAGTGFLVFLKDQDSTYCYLVSAKHVVKPILNNPRVPLSVRFNLKGGEKAEVIKFPTFTFNGKRWLEHTNSAIDLAVLPLTIFGRIRELAVGGYRVDSPNHDFFATLDWIDKYKVGPGDQVFTLGLVPYLYSEDNINLVLSRFGEISLLTKKELELPGGRQRAYFLDCQSFAGNSGGPAFILVERTETGALLAGWRFALLGVVTEFVPSPLRAQKKELEDTKQTKGFQLIENTGISKVVPVDYLVDILFSDEQKQFREKIAEIQKKKEQTDPSK